MRSDLVHVDAAIRLLLLTPTSYPGLIPPKKPSRKGCDWHVVRNPGQAMESG